VQPKPLLLEPPPGLERFSPTLDDAIARYCASLASFMRPALVQLCRLRIAQIVRGLDTACIDPSTAEAAGVTPAKLAALPTWFTSDQFDATERACLDFAEYFCYSAQSVTDEHVANVSAHLTPEQVLALTNAIWVTDSSKRLYNYLDSLGVKEAAR